MFTLRKHFVNTGAKGFLSDNNWRMDVGTAITQALSINGVSAAEVARRSGLRPGTISSYQSGRITPSLHALELIASSIGVRLSELIALAEDAPQDSGEFTYPSGGQATALLAEEPNELERVMSSFAALTNKQKRALLHFLETIGEER